MCVCVRMCACAAFCMLSSPCNRLADFECLFSFLFFSECAAAFHRPVLISAERAEARSSPGRTADQTIRLRFLVPVNVAPNSRDKLFAVTRALCGFLRVYPHQSRTPIVCEYFVECIAAVCVSSKPRNANCGLRRPRALNGRNGCLLYTSPSPRD